MRKKIALISAIVALLLILGGLSFAVELYFDYLWFIELGKTALFTTALYAKGMVSSIVLLISFLFMYCNFLYANRGPGLIQIGIPTQTGQITAYSFSPTIVQRLAGAAALVIGFMIAAGEADNWEVIWRWINRVAFNAKDPIFSLDVSFYFFTLPFFEGIIRLALILLFIALIGSIVLYYFKGALSFKRSRLGTGRCGVHLSFLASLIFLLLAASAFLDRYSVLFGDHAIFSGANYADLNARIPMLWVLVLAALVSAVLCVINAFSAGYKSIIIGAVIYVVVLFAGNIYPAFMQRFIVAPNEFSKESPQIKDNIDATLKAYGIDRVEERSLSGDKALTPQDIQNNMTTIHSIRLWDHEPLLDALKQIQEIRTYYDFNSVDNDRYMVDNELQQFMLSPRELNSASLPERTWINERLSYTHGYGVAVGPVNRMTSEGLPVLLVQNIPPVSTAPIFKINRPEIYYGELTRDYALVKSGQKEFDFPSGEENVYSTYQGSGGVPVNSFFRKLLFAFYFKDSNIVLSPLVNSETRFLYYRDVKTRMSRLAPFLLLDQDPYMVISEGRLFWIQDAYTISDRYPFSTMTQAGNYVRNSVKMVLDAYNGNVDMFVSDPDDPLIQVYQKIYKGVFRPLSEISPDLRKHLRYPEDIFRIQTAIYANYHMNNPQVYYNKEDLWEIPVIAARSGEAPMAPYYTIMRLPQEGKDEEFILMLPFTPGKKDNLSAWMVARNDGDKYGHLVVYRFPKQKLVYGPRQIVARINQEAEISKQISLWDQRGSEVIQGNLLVIPIEEALLYVRPLYIRSENGKIPELKRVVVAYENKIAMEETLEGALARIFNVSVSAQSDASTSQPQVQALSATAAKPAAQGKGESLIQDARSSYDRAIQAQRQGDWAKYGEEIKKLGGILENLNKSKSK